VHPPFSIIEGGLAAARETRRAPVADKVVRFENPTGDDEPPATYGRVGLHALDDEEGFGLVPAGALGHILDFEYNGVPARHGFLRD
jgi:hypothetical protein